MIKSGLKTYFKSLPYIFISLGALFVAVLLGGTLLFGGIVAQTKIFASSLYEAYSGWKIDVRALVSYVVEELWQEADGQLSVVLSLVREGDWLTECIRRYLEGLEGGGMQGGQWSLLLADYVSGVRVCVLQSYLVVLLGVVGGFFLTKYLIRRDAAKRSLWKWALNGLIDSLLSATVVTFVSWLLSVWSPGVLVTFLLSGLVFGLISLFEAYVIHGYKRVKFSQIVTGRNALCLTFVNILNFILSFLIVLAVYFIFNAVVAVAIGYALIILTMIVTGLNAEAFVVNEREKACAKQNAEQ